MDLPGIGPAGAARILADVGDVARFATKAHFASWTGGAAPISRAAYASTTGFSRISCCNLCSRWDSEEPPISATAPRARTSSTARVLAAGHVRRMVQQPKRGAVLSGWVRSQLPLRRATRQTGPEKSRRRVTPYRR
jgi:hypothetical protein